MKYAGCFLRSKENKKRSQIAENLDFTAFLAPQTGLEPAAFRLGGGPSIQLRYWGRYVIRCGKA